MRRPSIAELDASTENLLDSWREHAACYGLAHVMDPPEDRRTQFAEQAALHICRACPVIAECRAWVLSLPARVDPGGVCGGMTEADRDRARPVTVDLKRCPGCKQTKPTVEFHRNVSTHDGLSSYCKRCNYQQVKARKARRRAEAAAGRVAP